MAVDMEVSMHGSLRDEVQILRRRVIQLQNIGTEAEQLKKELTKAQEEKATLEMEFMNQLNSFARENAHVTQELEGRLAENDKLNRDLVEQFQNADTPEVLAKKIREIEARHEKELAVTIDDNQNEIKKCQEEMAEGQARKIELMAEVAERKFELEEKQKEIATLQAKVSAIQSGQSSVSQVNELEELQQELDLARAEATMFSNHLTESQAETARLKEQLDDLRSTLSTNTRNFEDEMKTLRDTLESYETELANKASKITQVECFQEEIQKLKTAKQELEDENQQLRSLQRASPTSKDRTEQENRELKFAQLESERKNRDVMTSRDSLEIENKELNLSQENLQRENRAINVLREKLEKDNQESKQSRQSFEKDNQELKKSRQSLVNENQELKKTLQSLANEHQQLKWSIDQPKHIAAHKTAGAVEYAIPQRSNSTIAERRSVFERHIQKLEKNTKKEWQPKLVMNTKFRKQQEAETGSSAARDDSDQLAMAALKTENGNLSVEVDDLKQKLEIERENVTSLRREVSDLKARTAEQRSNAPTICPSKNSSIDGPTSRHFSACKSPTSAGAVSPSVPELTQRLKRAKEMAVKLHQERSDLRASVSSRRPEASPSLNAVVHAPVREPSTPTREQLVPSKLPAMSIRTQLNPQESARLSADATTPRTPVRGLVQSLERRISQSYGAQIDVEPATSDDSEPPSITRSQFNFEEPPSITRSQFNFEEISAFTDNVDELQRALIFERQNIQELEAELRRQCEINCTLLQEINTLTTEAEAFSTKEAHQYEQKSIAHRKEIDGLSSDVLKLRFQVKQGSQFEHKSIIYQKEIDSLSSEVLRLRSQVKEGSAFELQSTGYHKEISSLSSEILWLKAQLTKSEGSRLDQSKQSVEEDNVDEIDRLKTHISQLQTDVGAFQEAIVRFQEKNMADQEGIEKLDYQVNRLESQLANEKRLKSELSNGYEIAVEAHKVEIQQLETEVAEMKLKLAEADGSKERGAFGQDEEVQRLQYAAVEVKSNLAEAEEGKEKVSEKEQEIERLELLIQDLRTQVNLVEDRSKKLAVEHDCAKAEVKGMRSQNANLIVELDKITENRDELESRDEGHQREFDDLRTKVDAKVAEVENVHRADQEQISRLRSQVKALQQELEDTFHQVEKLERDLKEKEGVEDTVEAMTISNKNLLDSQINKLQKELTKTQITKSDVETDYAKKIEELEDMIDSMQTEMDESVEEKEKEIKELKRGVELKDDMISRLAKEKDQLVLSMTDMMTSRRDEIDELQAELMEMSTRAADQVREVQNLKLQLADTGFRREEMDKMRCQVQEMREQVSERDDSRMDEKAELEVENSELRQRLRQVSLERQAGEEKLREFIANQGSSKTVQVLRERNATLKLEVEKMSKKLKKMFVHMQRQQKQSMASQSVGSKQSMASQSVESTRVAI